MSPKLPREGGSMESASTTGRVALEVKVAGKLQHTWSCRRGCPGFELRLLHWERVIEFRDLGTNRAAIPTHYP